MTAFSLGSAGLESTSWRPRLRSSLSGLALRVLTPIISLSVVAGLWEWAVRAGRLPVSVAAPSAIRDEFERRHEMLWFHTSPTLSAAIWGFVFAVAVALLVSAVVVAAPSMSGTVYNSAVVISSIPLIALTPVLVLWLDRGAQVRITIAAVASVFPILVGCIQGLGPRDERTDELFLQLAARPHQEFFRLRLPRSLPFVFAGLKAAAASAILGAVIAEWTGGGGTRGLGQLMVNALFGFNVALTWLTILTAAALSMACYGAVALLEKVVIRWEPDDTGLRA